MNIDIGSLENDEHNSKENIMQSQFDMQAIELSQIDLFHE